MKIAKLYIDGQFVDDATHYREVLSPLNQKCIGYYVHATIDQVDQAVQAAHDQFKHWSTTTVQQRADYLAQIAQGLRQREQQLIDLQMLNNGKPQHEAEVDVQDAIATFEYYAQLADHLQLAEEVGLASAQYRSKYLKQPIGVVGLIVPWNFPLVTSAWKIAPALLAGCCIILKPSEFTPLIENVYAEIADEVGLPDGVFNIVMGESEIGQALCQHPLLDKISFTGSNRVGAQIMETVAKQTKPITLELGGKSPILVFADCDLDQAAAWVIAGICWNAGQMCSATSRLLVEKSIADQFYQVLIQKMQKIYFGQEIGPITTQKQFEVVQHYFEIAHQEQLKCLFGGKRLNAQGWFVSPTLYIDVPAQSRLWCEEVFGPVLCSQTFESEQQAIQIANQSDFALAATICSQDLQRAERIAQQLQAGHIWINSEQIIFPQTSWGGDKKSGIGRELGPWGVNAFQTIKHVTQPVI